VDIPRIDPLTAPDQIRAAVRGMLSVESYMVRQDGAITIDGQLIGEARTTYRTLRQRIEAIGFTPFLGRTANGVRLTAIPGVIERKTSRVRVNIILFLLTVVTVLWTGAINETTAPITTISEVFAVLLNPQQLAAGIPFTLTLLGILGAHEMGHFIVGRLRGAPVSWPYFIPMPPLISFTGTMGAVIVQREPLEDRRTLLEVGIAGPLAGLAVAIPLLFVGLATSTVEPATPPYMQEGNSLMYAAAKWLVYGQFLPSNGIDVQINSIAFGAWIGLLVTMINLLPVGQLDGGHIAYALLGDRARYLAYAAVAMCAIFGALFSYSWFVWMALASIIGFRHPPPFNDVPELGTAHKVLAIAGLVLFLLLLMPIPIAQVQ
jgi:hypothetical protein